MLTQVEVNQSFPDIPSLRQHLVQLQRPVRSLPLHPHRVLSLHLHPHLSQALALALNHLLSLLQLPQLIPLLWSNFRQLLQWTIPTHQYSLLTHSTRTSTTQPHMAGLTTSGNSSFTSRCPSLLPRHTGSRSTYVFTLTILTRHLLSLTRQLHPLM